LEGTYNEHLVQLPDRFRAEGSHGSQLFFTFLRVCFFACPDGSLFILFFQDSPENGTQKSLVIKLVCKP